LSLNEYKPVFVLFSLIGLLTASVYVVSLYWPKYEEYFFELGLLGKDGKAEGYFPDDNSTIHIGSPVSWQIYLHNHMGSGQEIIIRVKVLNSTMPAPDDREHEPSEQPCIAEIPLTLAIDETKIIPFSWSVLDAEPLNGTVIKSLIINDEVTEVDVISSSDDRFRVVFELWVHDESSDQFVFGWYSKGEFYSASIYMWFNLEFPHY